jgi:hypothetical protein
MIDTIPLTTALQMFACAYLTSGIMLFAASYICWAVIETIEETSNHYF